MHGHVEFGGVTKSTLYSNKMLLFSLIHYVLAKTSPPPPSNRDSIKVLNKNGGFMLKMEGNGAPLQYSCLENPMDGGAW